MKVLVTGAAGYIGSVVTDLLVEEGHTVVAVDNLSNGRREAVNPQASFVEEDVRNRQRLHAVMEAEKPEAVVHLAAEALIDTSVTDPGRTFQVNVAGGLNVLDGMVAAGARTIVFSSSAAVYGAPTDVPVEERAPLEPVNAYGESKAALERMLRWYHSAHGINAVCLRYFNVCGATRRRGESRALETHLIPVALEAVEGARPHLLVYGTDYPTRDGTCVRDYLHVADVAAAHRLALAAADSVGFACFNLGSETGYTVLEVVRAIESVTGRSVPVRATDRRLGDPAVLVASSNAARTRLAWQPQFATLEPMIQSTWDWRLARSQADEQ